MTINHTDFSFKITYFELNFYIYLYIYKSLYKKHTHIQSHILSCTIRIYVHLDDLTKICFTIVILQLNE